MFIKRNFFRKFSEKRDEKAFANPNAFQNLKKSLGNALEFELSPKLAFVVNMFMREEKEEKQKRFVVYTEYVTNPEKGVKLIESMCRRQGISYASITGEIPIPKRMESISDYNSGRINFLILSKVGGVALDLKRTSDLFICYPFFTPSNESQLIGRVCRYNSHELLPMQERKVKIWKLNLIAPITNLLLPI